MYLLFHELNYVRTYGRNIVPVYQVFTVNKFNPREELDGYGKDSLQRELPKNKK
jgi:hypothetical protein